MNDTIKKVLKLDEGVVNKPYKDSLGYWTIGVGHYIGNKLEDLRLNDEAVEALLFDDLEECFKSAIIIFGVDFFCSLSIGRKAAIVSMIFNLGHTKFSQFRVSIKNMKDGDWELASKNVLKSKWATQVKNRAKRISYMLKTGEIHNYYKEN